MNHPVISLCIITYNQPESVEKIFQKILPQFSEEIEILIRDDSPNDLTENVVKKYTSLLPPKCIHYFKGEKSKVGGYDKALLFLTEKAKGEFLWWFGDDVLAPDAFQRILSEIKQRPKLSFLWLNAQDITNPLVSSFPFEGDRIYTNGSDIFQTNVGLLGFPSATLIKRNETVEHIDNAKKFIGTTLTGYYLVLAIITQKDKEFMIMQKPCIYSVPKPSGEARWYDSFQVHAINYSTIALDFKNKIDTKSYRKGISDQFNRCWKAVIVERALGFKTGFGTPGPKIMKMTKLYWTYPSYYFALPLMLLPRFIDKIAYKLYAKLKK